MGDLCIDFETVDEASYRFEQVGEDVVTGYYAVGRLVHLDVRRIST